MPKTKTGAKMGRPPHLTREQKILAVRKYVAETMLETGVVPSFRMIGDSLGYASSASSNVYAAIRNLSDDPRIIFVKTSWQGYVMPVEVFEAMQKAAQEVLDGYKDKE